MAVRPAKSQLADANSVPQAAKIVLLLLIGKLFQKLASDLSTPSGHSARLNNGAVSVVAQVGVKLAHLVEHLLEFIAFGEGVQFGAAFRRQAGVASLGSDRWGCVNHEVTISPC